MKDLDSNLQCPSCQTALRPLLLGCEGCGIRMEGQFHFNEFATLPVDDLHFLRVFVQAEGRVRDMEAALGLSYPTIRSRLSALKEKLATIGGAQPVPPRASRSETTEILEQLESGKLSFDQAKKLIRKAGKEKQ